MKGADLNVLAAMLQGISSGQLRPHRGPTEYNRVHRERAPAGSALEAERIAAAEAKRQRRAAKRVVT